MASAAPAASIIARLKSNWAHDDVSLLAPDDLENPPNPPQGFVVVEFPGGVAEQVTIGAPGENIFRETSAFMVHVQVPTADADRAATARGYADEIAAIFRGKQFDGVCCWAPYPPAEDTAANGLYWGLSFSVPYYFDRTA